MNLPGCASRKQRATLPLPRIDARPAVKWSPGVEEGRHMSALSEKSHCWQQLRPSPPRKIPTRLSGISQAEAAIVPFPASARRCVRVGRCNTAGSLLSPPLTRRRVFPAALCVSDPRWVARGPTHQRIPSFRMRFFMASAKLGGGNRVVGKRQLSRKEAAAPPAPAPDHANQAPYDHHRVPQMATAEAINRRPEANTACGAPPKRRGAAPPRLSDGTPAPARVARCRGLRAHAPPQRRTRSPLR